MTQPNSPLPSSPPAPSKTVEVPPPSTGGLVTKSTEVTPAPAPASNVSGAVDAELLERQRIADEKKLPFGSVDRAHRTGREPTVDLDDPTQAEGARPSEIGGAKDQADAIKLAKETGQQVAIPGHPRGFCARPNGDVGPRQKA